MAPPLLRRLQTRWVFFILIGTVLFLPACRRQQTGEKVEGTVLDTAGKAVPDVRVFNSGDGPKLIETHTDQLGRFRLVGINSGPLYVFAEKADCRFTGLRTTAGAADVAITLRSRSESPSPRAAASQPMPLDQQQKLARGMLEKLRTDELRGKQYPWVAEAMSRIDPELALRWAAESTSECTVCIRAAVAEKVADTDIDEALSLLGPSGPERRRRIALLKLVRRYRISDPAKARRCTEELVLDARASDQPWRAGYLAEAGNLAIQLGNKDGGRSLLDEAGEMAEKLASGSGHDGALLMVAAAMAPSDLNRAWRLLEPITTESNVDRFRAHLAMAVCLQNLDEALALAGKIKQPYDADRARLRIAYRLAPSRPADAIRVADMIARDPQGAEGMVQKTLALGWVAVAIAPYDKQLACSLIDRALTFLRPPDMAKSLVGPNGGWPARAAFLAIQAERIGYPERTPKYAPIRPTLKYRFFHTLGA